MIQYPNFNQALIISGDGDFHCLVEYLIEQNKLYKLIVPNYYKYSSLLRKFVYKIDFLNNLKQKLSKQKERH